MSSDVLKALNKGEKVRKKSWWWGRYIKKVNSKYRDSLGHIYPPNQIPTKNSTDWEIYDEEAHGLHNRDPIDAKYEDAYLRDIGRLK